jgi:hypothetical protein
MARPTKYTQELADEICRRIMDGESLRGICESQDIPDRSTVHLWLATNSQFSDQYARAKEEQADTLADDMQFIADTVQPDRDAVAKARLQIDTRKWSASKLKPKKYGDKMQLGNDPDNPLTNPTKELTDEELNARIRKIVAGKEN